MIPTIKCLSRSIRLVLPLILLPALVMATEEDGDVMAPLDCVINPSVVSDLGSAVPGVLSEIRVDRSDFVAEGDVIAQLESGVEVAIVDLARTRAELTAEVDLRRVNAAFGRRQHERSEGLFRRKVISTNDIDERETEARLAKLQLRQALDNQKVAKLELVRAEETLGRRTIASPLKGVVMERFKSVGEYVEDQPVVRVAQLDPLHVEVIVPVEKLGMVHKGMRARIWSDAVAGETWQATVSRVDQVADVASGTYGVRLELPNPDYEIPAGLRCRVQLTRAEMPPQEIAPVATKQPATQPQKIAPAPAATVPAAPLRDAYKQRAVEQQKVRPEPAVSSAVEVAAAHDASASKPVKVAPAPNQVEPEASAKNTNTAALMPIGDMSVQLPECRWAGPFADKGAAGRKADELRKLDLDVAVEDRPTRIQMGYQAVFIPPGGRPEAERIMAKLAAAGVKDMYLFVKKGRPTKVSVGLYKHKRPADERIEQLAKKGFATAELIPWRKSVSQYFLAIKGVSNEASRTVLAGLPMPDPAVAPTQAACERLAKR